jgi:hypothetical protein
VSIAEVDRHPEHLVLAVGQPGDVVALKSARWDSSFMTTYEI